MTVLCTWVRMYDIHYTGVRLYYVHCTEVRPAHTSSCSSYTMYRSEASYSMYRSEASYTLAHALRRGEASTGWFPETGSKSAAPPAN